VYKRQEDNPLQEPISFDIYHPEPLVIVISGPSGVGKDAVLGALRARKLPFHFVITATSRPPREGEVDGKDYHFVSKEKFEEMIAGGQLIEHAVVYGQYKGVPGFEVKGGLESGKDVVLRLDVQGAARIRSLFPDAVMIFLVPSNYREWLDRLQNRRTETEDELKGRVETAREELKRVVEFDYMVVNAQGRLERAVDDIIAIITSEHHRVTRGSIKL
jgi:guanylate kinase